MPGLILKERAAMVPLLHLALENGVHAAFVDSLLEVLGVSGVIRPLEVPTTGETLSPR